MTLSDRSTSRVTVLDLLRFGAAIAVTLYHFVSCYPSPADAATAPLSAFAAVTRYGYLGVNLFFMISGFVVLWSALNRDALGFVVSRVSRLFPAFWFSLAFTIALILALRGLVPQVDVPDLTARNILANITMVPAIFDAPAIEGVYWTLEIEVRFYALIFLLLLFRQMVRVELWLYVWLAASLACLALDLPWIINYLVLQPYGSFFVGGCLFYLVMARGLTLARGIGLLLSLGACMYVSIGQSQQFLTPDASSAIIVPALIVGFFALFALITLRPPKSEMKWAQPLGDLTYSLYLTHATMGLYAYHLLRPVIGLYATLLVITALALGVAWIVTRTVDVPARKPLTQLLNRAAGALGLRKPALKTAPSAQGQS